MEKSLMELLKEEQIWVDKLRGVEIDIKAAIDMNDEVSLNNCYVAKSEAEDNLNMVRRNIVKYHRSLSVLYDEPARPTRARYE